MNDLAAVIINFYRMRVRGHAFSLGKGKLIPGWMGHADKCPCLAGALSQGRAVFLITGRGKVEGKTYSHQMPGQFSFAAGNVQFSPQNGGKGFISEGAGVGNRTSERLVWAWMLPLKKWPELEKGDKTGMVRLNAG